MIKIDLLKCIGCGICVQVCPAGAIEILDKKAVVNNKCVHCVSCTKYCKTDAISEDAVGEETMICRNCGVKCRIPEGFTGACKRFRNEKGELVLVRPLQVPVNTEPDPEKIAILKPIVSAVGAGETYPDYKPAPYIVTEKRGDFDVVTVVTEAPVAYSSMLVKIDTNARIGDEGALVRRDGRVVGVVTTEQYGSHMLILGGVNKLKGPGGMYVAKTMAELGNKEKVTLTVDNGCKLELRVGDRPVINGVVEDKMCAGCGGGCCGLFARSLAPLIDEAIILDRDFPELLTKHPAGAELKPYSGVTSVDSLATNGLNFFEQGDGWGGTNIKDPIEAIKNIDMKIAKPGMKILVAETTWRKIALFEVSSDGKPVPIEIPAELEEFRKKAADWCEEGRVSAMYYAGVGGSARAGVTVDPIRITQAVHEGDATLTIAGAPAYVMPGGGITFIADVEKMIDHPFNFTATPALIAPVEYTMTVEKYAEIKGHVHAMRTKEDVLKEGRHEFVELKN